MWRRNNEVKKVEEEKGKRKIIRGGKKRGRKQEENSVTPLHRYRPQFGQNLGTLTKAVNNSFSCFLWL